MNAYVILGSSRDNGNTEQLTRILVDGIPHTSVYLRSKTILPILDQRHTPDGFGPIADDFESIVDEMLNHDVIVFSTPVYWYGMSGVMKDFVDRWSQALRTPKLDFKARIQGKNMFVVAVGGDAPRQKGLPLIQQFHYIFDFVGANFAGYIIGEANAPGDIAKDERAMAEARVINARWKQG